MQLEQARARDPIATSLFAWKAAIALLTIITSIFCVLTVIDAESAKCAGQESLLGQRSGMSDFLAPAIMSIVIGIGCALRVTSERVRRYFLPDGVSTFRVILASYSMFCVTAALAGFILILGMMTWISAQRYNAIADYCRSVDAPATPVGMSPTPSVPMRQ